MHHTVEAAEDSGAMAVGSAVDLVVVSAAGSVDSGVDKEFHGPLGKIPHMFHRSDNR
jgi:hypothetical protein